VELVDGLCVEVAKSRSEVVICNDVVERSDGECRVDLVRRQLHANMTHQSYAFSLGVNG